MKLLSVHQKLVSRPLADVEAHVHRTLDASEIDVPRAEVAITAGSRGIDNIATITRAVGDWLKSRGARPFVAPCMGSHNGATAEGQRRMVESLGITEEAMEMELRSSMDAVRLGTVASGDVYMDKHCFDAGHIFVLNRIKLHTCFSGPIQSGLTKMIVVGMGKICSAQTFHSADTPVMKDMLLEMGRCILGSGKIVGGLAVLEDGFDKSAELHALHPSEFLEKEPELLERHREYFPTLPLDDLDVLIVDSIGKTYSGTGMDTNVIGYRGVKGFEDLTSPRIRIIGALGLAAASQGNAIGVGLADFITRRLRDAIDEEKTFINVYTTGDMQRSKIPTTLPTDEALVSCIADRFGEERWLFVPNTLHLEHLYASTGLRGELAGHPQCEVEDDPVSLGFDRQGRHRLSFFR